MLFVERCRVYEKIIRSLVFILVFCMIFFVGCKKEVKPSFGENAGTSIEDKMMDDKETENILRYMNFEIEEYTIHSTDITSLRIDEHFLNEELKTDTVLTEYSAEIGKMQFEFSANVVFSYNEENDSWEQTEYSINPDYIISFIKSYRFELPVDEIASGLASERFGIEVMGTTYYSDENEISNVKYGRVEPDGSDYLYVDLDFTLSNEDISIEVKAKTEFKYTEEKGWNVYFIDETKVKSVECGVTGIWTGKDSAGNLIFVEIKGSENEEAVLSAYVEVRNGDETELGFNAIVNEFSADAVRGDYVSLKNIGWVKEPNSGNSSQWQLLYGRISDGVWTIKCNSENLELSK